MHPHIQPNAMPSINAHALEERANAVRVLYEYSRVLCDVFDPYVDETAKSLLPLVGYRPSETIRVHATMAAEYVVRAAITGVRKGTRQVGSVVALAEQFIDAFLKVCCKHTLTHAHPHPHATNSSNSSPTCCIVILTNSLTQYTCVYICVLQLRFAVAR